MQERDNSTTVRSDIRYVLPDFEGPLDLLLHLIEQSKLEVTRIALCDITDQFLAVVRTVDEAHLEQASAFVVMASTLLAIKSRQLLPKREMTQIVSMDEEVDFMEVEFDEAEVLVQQLHDYQRMKTMAHSLGRQEQDALQFYSRERLAVTTELLSPPPLTGVTLLSLRETVRSLLIERRRRPPALIVYEEIVTIQQRMQTMREQVIRQGGQLWLSSLLQVDRHRYVQVVTWMALLELVHHEVLACEQHALLADVSIWLRDQERRDGA